MNSTIKSLFLQVAVVGTCLLLVLDGTALHAQYRFTRDFSYVVQLNNTPTASPNVWSVDRYAPHGFENSTDLGGNVLKESISTADKLASRPAGYQTAFRNSQGRALILPQGTTVLKADLYIFSDWQATNKRMAGLWAATVDADNKPTEDYPIIEFASDTIPGGTVAKPGFRGWNNITGIWEDMGLPDGFTYNTWVTLEIDINPDGGYTYKVGDKTLASPASTAVKLHTAILQGYNYDPGYAADDINNPGVSYSIYWDNLTSIAEGNNVYNITKGSNYGSIQDAISDANTDDHIIVSGDSYNEQILINKSVSLKGGGATMPVIDFSGTPTGKPTLVDISADNVTIDSLHFRVDLSKLMSAVIASGPGIDTVRIVNSIVDPYGTPAGSYSDRNAFSINYTGAVNYRVASGGVENVLFKNNTVNAPSATSAFRSGLSADEAAGTFTGNSLTSISQDLLLRFLPAQSVKIEGNKFNDGGVEISSMNSSQGDLLIQDNTFDGTLGSSYTSSLRLKDNYNSKPTIVRNNIFRNHVWGISLENFNNETIDHNEFTPLSTAVSYRHITFNTKDISSTSGYGTPKVGGVFINNTFNGSEAGSSGIGIAFYNHDNDNPVFEPIVLGEAGQENIFQANIAHYLYLDNSHDVSTDALTAAFPEYGDNVPATLTGYWTANIEGSHNKFDMGSGPETVNDLNYYQINAINAKITDKHNDPNVGLVTLKLPVINRTKEAASTTGGQFRYLTIQEAIDAASIGDSIYAKAWVYNEDVNINKAGLTLYGDLHYGSDTTIVIGQNNGDPSLNANANNVTVSNLMVTRAGNDAADFASNLKLTGVNVGQLKQGITLHNLLVTGNRNGIYLNNVKGTVIKGCDVIFNRTGIQLVNNCDSTTITGNNIVNNWTLGLVTYGSVAGVSNSVNVMYNKISDNWYSNVENRSEGTLLNYTGNNWGADSVFSTNNPSGEPGYDVLFPVEYGGAANSAMGNHYLISGATDRVDYTAWLPAATPNAVDNTAYPGYTPQDTSVVYVDEASPTLPGMTKLERAASIVSAGGKIVMNTNVIHSTLVPGKPFNLESDKGSIVIDGIDFGDTTGVITLNQSVTITQALNLGDGVIKMANGDSLIVDASSATITTAGNGYVEGTLAVKNITGNFVFPVGDSAHGGQYISLQRSSGNTGDFVVSYADSGYSNRDLAAGGLTSLDTTRFWVLNRLGGDLGGLVTLSDYTNTIPLNSVIAHFGEDGQWHNLGGIVTSVENPRSITAEIASEGFSPFTFGSIEAALAVGTTGLHASLDGKSVLLSWNTTSESNNKGFDIERSLDGKNWSPIAFVNSLAAGGTSSKPLSYQASDNVPYQGLNYYRLKQVALDGKYEYSTTISIAAGGESWISIYPNPATTQITVTGMQGNIHVFDVSGKFILSQKATSPHTTLNIGHIAPGVYFIKDENQHSMKFIKK